jgi:hypothetical protein
MTDVVSFETGAVVLLAGVSVPTCPACKSEMQQFGKLPGVGLHAETDVFRCVACKTVASRDSRPDS